MTKRKCLICGGWMVKTLFGYRVIPSSLLLTLSINGLKPDAVSCLECKKGRCWRVWVVDEWYRESLLEHAEVIEKQ